MEDGNKIWATVKVGSNQDGCTTKPMTAPSGDQQLELFRRVYKTYQFDPSDIQYIEAHGKLKHSDTLVYYYLNRISSTLSQTSTGFYVCAVQVF